MLYLLNFINKHSSTILRIVGLLPVSLQKKLKKFYRGRVNARLYLLNPQSRIRPIFKDGKYTTINSLSKNDAKGVNLIGFPRAEFGLAEHLRSVGQAFQT
ncbi:MAG: hypothetical protein SFT91_06360, partial [Rickettsiaceae bacterium]|nr:hypothetical protein [Rickettsiaceae bacterium]